MFRKIADSFFVILFGIVLLPGGIALLFWNECRAVNTARSLEEGEALVVHAEAGAMKPGNENKLIHVTSNANTADVLRDPVFHVAARAIRLHRTVEMYQWKEIEHQGESDHSKSYMYEEAWSSEPIESASFHNPAGHKNPTQWVGSELTLTAKNVRMGAFQLSKEVISKMNGGVTLPLDGQEKVAEHFKPKAQVFENSFYFGSDPRFPEIGNQRVAFTVLNPEPFSIIAMQTGGTLAPFPTHSGRNLALVELGEVTPETMFRHAETHNKELTWILRAVGLIAMEFGFLAMLSPISALLDFVPLFGGILELGLFLSSLVLSMVIGLATVSIAWISYQPVLGYTLLACAAIWLLAGSHFGKRKRARSR